jgi:hypothetical protein
MSVGLLREFDLTIYETSLALGAGAVLWLGGFPHAAVRCTSDIPAVLVAIRRLAGPAVAPPA